jgi:hypothetical protein
VRVIVCGSRTWDDAFAIRRSVTPARTVDRLTKPGRGDCPGCSGPVTHAVREGGKVVFRGCWWCCGKRVTG